MTYSQDEIDFWNAHERIRAKRCDSVEASDIAHSGQAGNAVAQFEAYRPRMVSREQIRLIA